MSNETAIMLAPSPGAPGDFLATVTPEGGRNAHADGEDLPFEITLDNYTREVWGNASVAGDVNVPWKTIHLRSIDGRNKLPGE